MASIIVNKVNNTVRKYSLLNSGDRVVVAVSGGPDSVCLLFVLRELAKQLKLSLLIAHLDHMFRGKESEGEAHFVERVAKQLDLSAVIEKIDVPAYCRDRGLSAQEGARELRYAFLNRVADRVSATRIATGHTANDQAETFLLRCIRGAGVSGLSSIPPLRENIIRPLLEVTRDEVIEYLRTNKIEYVLDSSNSKPVYTRNRIRLGILPGLMQLNPRIVETLAAEASLLRDEDDALDRSLASLSPEIMTEEQDKVILQKDAFNALMTAFKRRMLKKAVQAVGGDKKTFSLIQIDEAISFLATAQTGRSMRFGPELMIEREYEKFILRRSRPRPHFTYALSVPGRTVLQEAAVEAEASILEASSADGASSLPDSDQENYFWQAVFDYDKIGPNLKVRNRLPGDWFCPAGMNGNRKKLQDFFVDAKVPRIRRDEVALLVSGDTIAWVAGFRTDERFLPGPDTKQLLIVRFRSISDVNRTGEGLAE